MTEHDPLLTRTQRRHSPTGDGHTEDRQMHPPTDPVVIVSDDPSFRTELQQRLEDDGYATTVHRSEESTPDALAAQQPGLLVVHASDTERSAVSVGTLAEQVQHAPAIGDVPVLVCADHRVLRQEAVKHLAQHRGTVVVSSSQMDEVRAKLHDLDTSSPPA